MEKEVGSDALKSYNDLVTKYGPNSLLHPWAHTYAKSDPEKRFANSTGFVKILVNIWKYARLVILGASIIVRGFFAFLTLFIGVVLLRLLDIGADPRLPLEGIRGTVREWVMRGTFALILAILGIFIVVEHEDKKKEKSMNPPIYCLSHETCLDALVGGAAGNCSPVAKESIVRFFVWRWIAVSSRALLVKRPDTKLSSKAEHLSSKNGVTTEIIARAHDTEHKWPSVCICCEGTTTANNVVIRLKTGAFHAFKPVQPVSVRYYNIIPWGKKENGRCSWLSEDIKDLIERMFLNVFTIARVKFHTPVAPTAREIEQKDARSFADRVGSALAAGSGTTYVPYTCDDYLYYMGKVKTLDKVSDEWKRDYVSRGIGTLKETAKALGYERKLPYHGIFLNEIRSLCKGIDSDRTKEEIKKSYPIMEEDMIDDDMINTKGEVIDKEDEVLSSQSESTVSSTVTEGKTFFPVLNADVVEDKKEEFINVEIESTPTLVKKVVPLHIFNEEQLITTKKYRFRRYDKVYQFCHGIFGF